MVAATQPAKIAATNVTVTFGRQTVLRDVTVAAAPGETLAVIGESGCGKTVLLKTLIRLVQPTRGVVSFEGAPIARLGERKITELRRRLGFVFQNAALFDSMSIADNVAFPLRDQHRMDREEAYEVVAERLAEVGLPASVMLKKPAELSGGMRKRVGLARALANSPEVLLYDEPTTGLDPIMSDVINELIMRTRDRRGVTSVVVTHDMHSACKVADRIVMLYPVSRLGADEPQILFDGTPDEIMRCDDRRVSQFVRGEAGERLEEMRAAQG
ncbi:putative ABC transporter ATP-binding protein [Posidoniimonas corsicana]|uniref:Putative ABC transporter ATP-binding protein n=1 Tax=Posidoniimonas corsicana TaxID=1938618 RepID=A0A5C5V870_9BACT|nr:ATP-binding cassette domain-containing protein [Posidoniimonas corsicana]TWT34027.1 putative ABC transporter ATP-binding protein [Posidoniimonas corsicana]